jgi:hypothetical protein
MILVANQLAGAEFPGSIGWLQVTRAVVEHNLETQGGCRLH